MHEWFALYVRRRETQDLISRVTSRRGAEPIGMKHSRGLMCLMLLVGCGGDDDDGGEAIEMPHITPPVRAAAPEAFTQAQKRDKTVEADVFVQRFFSDGPTDLFGILEGIDARIDGQNDRAGECKTAPSTSYTIEPFGESVAMKASCVEMLEDDFVQFDAPDEDDPSAYLYEAFAVGHRAAIITPVEGAEEEYVVDAWIAVGYDNAEVCGSFDCGSYSAMAIHANSATGEFEMSVAGLGIGFCGAQLRSDGTSIYGIGSDDAGDCGAESTMCVDAANLDADGTCDDLTTFELAALGRLAGDSFGASAYPSRPNLTLDGTAGDGIHFGPSEPTAGVGSL